MYLYSTGDIRGKGIGGAFRLGRCTDGRTATSADRTLPVPLQRLSDPLAITASAASPPCHPFLYLGMMIPPILNGPQFSAATISGITGSISIACWLVVFSPQIIENFRRQSGESLSLSFLVIWLAGDVFNVLGAILQHVLPTMIILALYCISRGLRNFADVLDTLADIILIAQVLYYRKYPYHRHRHPHPATRRPSHLSPATPLLDFDRPPKKPPPISTIRACTINVSICLC